MRTDRRWLVVALGAVLRLALCLVNWLHPTPELTFAQADGYMAAARFLQQHGHIPDPVFTPGYMYFVAAVQRLAPTHTTPVLLLLQWLVDCACIPIVMWLAGKCGGYRVSVVAGLLVAVDPLLLIQPSLVLTESLYTPMLLGAVCLFVTAVAAERRARFLRLSVCAGLLVGLSVLVRSVGVLVLPAMFVALLVERRRSLLQRVQGCVALAIAATVVILPLCLQNQAVYGHFAISSSSGFNLAALVVGPVRRAHDHNTGKQLLDMWKPELGSDYLSEPPFVLSARASQAALRWARAHPVITAEGILIAQGRALIAPERPSWIAGLSPLHLGPRGLFLAIALLTLMRATLSALAIWAVTRALRNASERTFAIFLLLLIGLHLAASGAAGVGRLIAPVSPYIDILAACGAVSLGGHRCLWKTMRKR